MATETKAAAKTKEKRVQIMIPYIEGEAPEEVVIINGKAYQIQKGRTVNVPENVAKVLENANLQVMAAAENREKFKNQVTDL